MSINQIGNYEEHAAIWDWSGYDRTAEFKYWSEYARSYGNRVLIPFCALGEIAAYMAADGFKVTAFDITEKMISEGKKRFDGISDLQLFVGDVTGFCFDIPPADFCFATDFGHIHTIDKIKTSLSCISKHLREDAGLVIEASLPATVSSYIPPKTFYPIENPYSDKKVWKIGDTRNDAKTGRCYISQTIYIEDSDKKITQFEHLFYMQNYSLIEWRSALEECGFIIKAIYKSRERDIFEENDEFIIIEARKKGRNS